MKLLLTEFSLNQLNDHSTQFINQACDELSTLKRFNILHEDYEQFEKASNEERSIIGGKCRD